MDWRFNTIWFDKIESEKFYSKDFKNKILMSENSNPSLSEYAILWYFKEKEIPILNDFQKLKYLELNWSNIKNFNFLENLNSINRLNLECCTKLETDDGISLLQDTLQFLYIGTSKKFIFSNELLKLKKLRVLSLNSCGEIDNLDFLNNFPNLIDFRFVDTNIKSGDLTPILKHKKIKSVGFQNKRQYNFKNEEMKKLLEEKNSIIEKTYEYEEEFETYRYTYE